MKIRVKPIYGWGWFTEDSNTSVEVPSEFDLEIEIIPAIKSALGCVDEPNHPLASLWILLSSRGIGYNLCAYQQKPDIPLQIKPCITGFALVTPVILGGSPLPN